MTITTPKNPGWGPLWQGLFRGDQHYRRLRNGCGWIYFLILAFANHRTGKFATTWGWLAEYTELSEAQLKSLAGHLRAKGYTAVVKQGPDHVLFVVNKWRPVWQWKLLDVNGRNGTNGDKKKESGTQPLLLTPPLALEVTRGLGADEHLEEIIELVGAYPASIIRKFLESAKAVPEDKIKVSRYALFRWLLSKHGNTHDDEEGA